MAWQTQDFGACLFGVRQLNRRVAVSRLMVDRHWIQHSTGNAARMKKLLENVPLFCADGVLVKRMQVSARNTRNPHATGLKPI
jgi:hypothetical protein